MKEYQTIDEELKYIYSIIKKYVNKWKIKKLILINHNTKEDIAFNAIYNNFKENLPSLENVNFIEEINFLKEKAMLINTDTILKKETSLTAIITPFTLNVFADYTPDFINEVLTYFKIEQKIFTETKYDTNKELSQLIYILLKGEKKFEEITEEEKKKLTYFFREKNKKTNCKITNSYNRETFKNYYLGIFD